MLPVTAREHRTSNMPAIRMPGSKPYFDRVASDWDRLRESFFSDAVRGKAYAKAGLVAGQSAADLGAGTGYITEGLLARGLHVIAIDQSPEMLEAMRKKFGAAALVEYRLGDASKLPIDDASVRYAFANMYLHHVEDPPLAIREMARILKPRGRLVITDLDEHDFAFLRTEHHDQWMGFRRDDVARWFVEAGLRGVDVGGVNESCCASSADGSAKAKVDIFAAVGEK